MPVWLARGLYVPARQFEQLEASGREMVPGGHVEHAGEPAAAKEPAGQPAVVYEVDVEPAAQA